MLTVPRSDAAAQAANSAQEANSAAKKAADSANSILGLDVQAETLSPGSPASAEATWIDGYYRITLGLPEGQPGPQGERGEPGHQGERGEPGKGLVILDYYDTQDSLESAVPSPEPGDAYGVGTAKPYDIYIYSLTHGWVNNGQLQGPQGETGPAGYTPVRGTDYWTADDKAQMVQDVLAALPTWEGGSY